MTPSHNDFLEICDLRYRYATGIDTRNWALHRSIFVDDIAIDFSSYSGQPPLGAPIPADSWVDGLQNLFPGLAATQHTMTNPRLTVSGDSAQLTTYMQAEHFLDFEDPTAWFTIGGYYTDDVVRTTDGWKFRGVTLTIFWRRGRADIMVTASERARALRAG